MKTTHKIAAARAIYRVMHAGRALVGRTDRQTVNRDGITYDLDLAQGIDFAIYLGFYERRTSAALRRLVTPGSVALDIGANIGAHTLTLADLVGASGKVLAFEPTDYAFTKLCRNLSLNPELARRVSAYHCFLAAADADAVPSAIYSSWPLTHESGLHAKHLGREMKTEAARARSIDSVLAEAADRPVSLVKLDVDGFECDVLKGATKLLSETRPIFVMELAPYVLEERGASLAELLGFFAPRGYRFYDENTNAILPASAVELSEMIPDGGSMNVVARVG